MVASRIAILQFYNKQRHKVFLTKIYNMDCTPQFVTITDNTNGTHITYVNNGTNITSIEQMIRTNHVIWHEDNRIIMILHLNVEQQHVGIGTMLLRTIINYALDRPQIQVIELDDMSDNAWNMDHNIYIKLGFKYKHTFPFPEMELHLDDLRIPNFENLKI